MRRPTVSDVAPIPDVDQLLEVRAGRVQALGRDLQSAIFKLPQEGPVKVTSLGIEGDQQQAVVHGGVEKALRQYSSAHHPFWQQEKPDSADMLQKGAFGENLVTEHLNEENVWIGDVFRIGKHVEVVVGEPRQPCYKLNHRFQWVHAQKRVLRSGKVGWYLRVLKEGMIEKGDAVVLVERPYPSWSVAKTQSVLHDTPINYQLVEELDRIGIIGSDIKKLVRRRLEQQSVIQGWETYQLVTTKAITSRVRQLTLALAPKQPQLNNSQAPLQLDTFAHAQIRFGPKTRSYTRTYSVVSGDQHSFSLGIAPDDRSRGGPRYLHEQLQVGDEIQVKLPNSEPVEEAPKSDPSMNIDRYIFIIGGIGVTAFLPALTRLLQEPSAPPCEVHYACRSASDAAYLDRLPANTRLYLKNETRLNLKDVIPALKPDGEHRAKIFCCGPTRLMDECKQLVDELGYPADLLHFETFGPGPIAGEPFDVDVRDVETDRRSLLHVPSDRSLLQVLRESGFDVPSNCESGKCGMCVVSLCGNNEVEHKGPALDEDFRKVAMLSCVDRGKGRIGIEIE